MSRSWNAASPRAFCNIYHHRVGGQNKVEDPRTGRMTKEFWLMSRAERWAALVSSNPTMPIRALQMIHTKYDHVNGRAETQHAKRNDTQAWGEGRAYIRHEVRTHVRSKLIPQELEQYAADQIVEDEWTEPYDPWMDVMYELWAEDDDAWLAWAFDRMDADDFEHTDEEGFTDEEQQAFIETLDETTFIDDSFRIWAEPRLSTRKTWRN